MKRIRKDSLKEVLKNWALDRTVIAPRRTERGECIYDTFDEAGFTLDIAKPSAPPKRSLFPQSEVIFQIEQGGYRQAVSSSPTLLFGIRPCDHKGLLQSQSFMSQDLDDPYYRAKSEKVLTVVMACPGSMSPTCFCTTTSSGPWAESGFDLQLYDDGDAFLVEIGSERGFDLVSSSSFEEMDDAKAAEKIRAFQKAAGSRIPIILEVEDAMERLETSNKASDEVWEGFGKKCITCGGCSFVCPTCTCFTVSDRVVSVETGDRIRSWDSCLYAGFTKEASGHNPRRTSALRIKRRHEHKLLYHKDRDHHGGLCTCVGCGRCSDYCPVHIGLIEVAQAICSAKDSAGEEKRYSGGVS